MTSERARPALLALAGAFFAVYVIWGSTYLAIRFAVETMPPFLMASARWLLPGGLLYAWMRARGAPRPSAREWRSAAVVGAFLIVGGNGTVSWVEQYVPSGLTALLIASVPVWIALLEWASPRRVRPAPRALLGIGLGVLGVALLPSGAGDAGLQGPLGVLGAALLVGASLSWATGSLYSRGAPRPRSLLQFSAMQMLAGGAVLAAVGLATGEAARLDLAGVSARSWLSFGFLAVFGTLVAYSCYVWLLQVTRAELVATYAFVNPVVAVLLGVVLAGEAFPARTALVAGLIVAAVALVVTAPRKA